MPFPRWYHLVVSCLEREQGAVSKFMQLATLTTDGNPAVRTIVFRGWHPLPPLNVNDSPAIMTCTDTRSQKISQLNRHPYAELCWYFQQSRQQFRITGSVKVITGQESDMELLQTRIKVWKGLSPSARLQFSYPTPGEPRDSNGNNDLFNPSVPDDLIPVEEFTLLLIQASRVDFVDLRANQRIQFTKSSDGDNNDKWTEYDINP